MYLLKPSLLAASAITLVACTTTTTADPVPETAATQSAAPATAATPQATARAHSKESFFDAYDKNGDGKVSEAEFLAEREVGYRRRDADQDGNVHSEEYVSEYEVRLIEKLEKQHKRQIDQAEFRFTVLDTDEDGNLSFDEFNVSGERMFSTLDTNKDGVVDESDTTDSY